MYESATYDAMAELVAQRDCDLYVFDMPPFGHGVRMVAMADILSRWVDKITEARTKVAEYDAVAASLKGAKATEDMVLKELTTIRSKIKTFTDMITDRQRTAFFMVLIPERMAILDTERALQMFRDLGITLSGLVVNQVYPVEMLDTAGLSDFTRKRILMQQQYVQQIQRVFGDTVVATMPMFPREPKGLTMLEEVAGYLMGKQTPGGTV
jgi:arsenite-transporting ATPase